MKKLISKYYYNHIYGSALDYRLRKALKNESFAELKPYNKKAAVSDLFVWRCNQEWETDFEVFNITSFIFPECACDETCRIIIFNNDGKFLREESFTLKAFEKKTLKIEDYLNGLQGTGTFAIFHHSPLSQRFADKQSHITERGYIGYRRKGDALKSFCHGNLQSLSQGPKQSNFSYVAAVDDKMRYHPQLIVSDCKRFELIYTNPSSKARALNIVFYDRNNNNLSEIDIIVPSCGVRIVSIENNDQRIHTFDNTGEIIMWRPVIVKFYETHFDAMHG